MISLSASETPSEVNDYAGLNLKLIRPIYFLKIEVSEPGLVFRKLLAFQGLPDRARVTFIFIFCQQ